MWKRLEMSARGFLNLRLKVFLKDGAESGSGVFLFVEKGGIFSLLLGILVKDVEGMERAWRWRRHL